MLIDSPKATATNRAQIGDQDDVEVEEMKGELPLR